MKRFGLFQLAVVGAALSFCLPELRAQSYSRISLPKRPAPITPANQGRGHALRVAPPLRPLTYLVTPSPTNNTERAFPATTPNPPSWIRTGTDVNRTYGDYYVNPAVWTNNAGLTPADVRWRDPNNPTNWISTRAMRQFLRRPYTFRPTYSQLPWR